MTNNQAGALTKEDFHKKMAVDLFNNVWTYLDLPSRTEEQEQTMIHAAHASRYHWEQIGKPINKVRGDWQLSRVYAVCNRAEPALYHAQKCLDLCLQEGIGDFDLAFAYEAMARAYHITGDAWKANEYKELAREACTNIQNQEDKEIVLEDLRSM